MNYKNRAKVMTVLALSALMLISGCSDSSYTPTETSKIEGSVSENIELQNIFTNSSNNDAIGDEISVIENSVFSEVSEDNELSVSENTEIQSEPDESSIVISSSTVENSSETINRNNVSNTESSVGTANNNRTTNSKTSTPTNSTASSEISKAPTNPTTSSEISKAPTNPTTSSEPSKAPTNPATSSEPSNTSPNPSAVTEPSNIPSTVAVTGISLNKSSVSLAVGSSEKISATISPSNATNKSYTYTSSNKSVATISSDGTIKAISAGSANITAKSSNGKTAVCKVTVYALPTRVTLNKTSLELNKGETYTLSANTDIDNSKVTFSWSSSNSAIISVESNGSQAKVTAKNSGTATVTVKTDNGKTASCEITVNVNTNSYIDEVISIVNAERASMGLAPLAKRDDLCDVANIRAKETVERFEHTRPNGTSCFSILQENNIDYYAAGENIAMGQKTPEEVMSDWMSSQGHKDNILSEKYNAIGVGCYESNGVLYWVQIFVGA